MADPRIAKLAEVLIHYSTAVKAGDLVQIQTTSAAAPLVRELYREILQAGAHALLRIGIDGTDEILYRYGSETQLSHVPQVAWQEINEVSARLLIMAPENTKSLSAADPAKVSARRKAMRPLSDRFYERVDAGEADWGITLFPTNASAQDAEMSLEDYEDFVYGAGLLGEDDPVAAWRRVAGEQQRIADFLGECRVIRLVAAGTDLTYHTAGRSWINADGRKNFPDGEVFTSPDEMKTEGHIHFSYPAIFSGREVEDIRLTFEAGKVVAASAGKGEELLLSLLDMDEGARRLGEAAFGTNYNIQRFTRNILFDEKIGGTIHLALGSSFAEIGGQNRSALHWDMVCDMRAGEAYADGRLFYTDGKFLI